LAERIEENRQRKEKAELGIEDTGLANQEIKEQEKKLKKMHSAVNRIVQENYKDLLHSDHSQTIKAFKTLAVE